MSSFHFIIPSFHFIISFTTSRFTRSQQGVEVGIEVQLKEAWAQNVED